MADKITVQRRSYNMAQIRSKNTRPEIIVRRWLHGQGFRYRLHCNTLPGKPDIVLPRFRAVVLVNGCFWHGHEGHPCFKVPSTRTEWWQRKLGRNKARDWQHQRQLELEGWKVITLWECELRPARFPAAMDQLKAKILGEEESCSPIFSDSEFYPYH